MSVFPIANLNQFHHQLNDNSHGKVYALPISRTDKQRRMDEVLGVVSRIEKCQIELLNIVSMFYITNGSKGPL